MSTKQITVRVPVGVHRAAKLRAVTDGLSLQDLGAAWFSTYGLGGTVTASTELTVGPRGLAAGDQARTVESPAAAPAAVSDRAGAGGAAGSDAPEPTTVAPPAARPCPQAFKHHINHTGRPCKECGYPVKEAGIT